MDLDVRNIVIGGSVMATDDDAGGSGGECIQPQPQPTTRDIRLTERAIRESWDLPEVTRQAMLDRLGTLVSDPATKTRAFLAAAKTLTALSRINLSAVDVAIRAVVHEDLGRRLPEAIRAGIVAMVKAASGI